VKIKNTQFLLIFLIGILNFVTLSDVFANNPHLVGGYLQYSDGSHPASVTWTAYITTRPGEIINQSSTGSVYNGPDTGGFGIQCAEFFTQWSGGDVLHADFSDGAGGTASIDVILANDSYTVAGTVTMNRIERQITITTVPAGLQIIAGGETYTSPKTFTWGQGSVHTLNVNSPQSLGQDGVQYAFASWSDDGAQSHDYTVPDGNATVTATFNTQYQLEINSAHGNPFGGGWYDTGTSVEFGVTTPSAGGTGIQYVFTGWTGSGSGSYTDSQATYTVTMNNPITETASWKTQYRLTTSVAPVGGGTITTVPSGTWFDENTELSVNAAVNPGYTWGGWSGDLSGTTRPENLVMDGPKSVIANFGAPSQITINTSIPGLAFTVDGTTYTTPQTFTWFEGTQHDLSVTTPQAGPEGTRYVFKSWSPDGSSNTNLTYTVPGTNQTVTANFKTQHQLTVNSFRGNPTGSGWYDKGDEANFSVTSPIDSEPGSRFKFNGWTGTGAGSYTGNQVSYHVIMNNPITETADWKKQYYLEVNSAHGDPEGERWWDANEMATFSVTSPDVQDKTRYMFNKWVGSYNGTATSYSILMDEPKEVTAYWKTQYYLTTIENPDEGGNMTPAPPGAWYDRNEIVTLNTTINPGFQWFGWSGSLTGMEKPTTINMDAPKSVTANYSNNSLITVNTNVEGLAFTVDGTTYNSSQVFNWLEGSQHTISTSSPQDFSGLEYVFTSWSDGGAISHAYTVPVDNQTVTANFTSSKVNLTLSVSPAGSGTTVPAAGQYAVNRDSVVALQAVAAEGYYFVNWTGEVADPNNSNTTVTMSGNKSVTANFARSKVTLNLSASPEGLGTTIPAPGQYVVDMDSVVSIQAVANEGYRFRNWTGDVADPNNPVTTVTMNGNKDVTANFKRTDITLTLSVNPVNAGTTVPPAGQYTVETDSVVSIRANAVEGYRFVNWSGGVTNPDSARTTVLMDTSKNITANFIVLTDVVITTEPVGLRMVVDGTPCYSPHVFSWVGGTEHTIGIDSTIQNGSKGIRYLFEGWSDEGGQTHKIIAGEKFLYTANFSTKYYLFTKVEPVNAGSITPAPPGAWYDDGSVVPVTAIENPESGYVFWQWSADPGGAANPDTVVMDTTRSVTAQFTPIDAEAPLLTCVFPVDGAQQLPQNTSIQFKLFDIVSGVNPAALQLNVNHSPVILNGLDQTGGFADIILNGSSCAVNYQPELPFETGDSVVVEIQCQDRSAFMNKLDSTFTFNIGSSLTVHTKKDTVGQGGGAVFDDTTGITVTIPENALADTTEITINVVEGYPELPPGKKGLPLGAYFGPPGLQFADSVTISIPYDQTVLDSAGVTNPMELKVYYYSVLTGEWITLKVFGADELHIYVKVKEFCYLVYGVKYTTLSIPAVPAGQTKLLVNTLYGFETSKVSSMLGHTVEYRFDWGDGHMSAWSQDTTAAHKWTDMGRFGIVAFARSLTDPTQVNRSDTLFVTVTDLSAIDSKGAAPTSFTVSQNFPNPFNPQTTIRYQVPKNEHVALDIYNISGQKIRMLVNEEKTTGYYTVIWDGKDDYSMAVSSGLYFLKMKAGDYTRVIKMSFLK